MTIKTDYLALEFSDKFVQRVRRMSADDADAACATFCKEVTAAVARDGERKRAKLGGARKKATKRKVAADG